MSLVGTQGKTQLMDSGEFYCPSCDGRRPYEHKRVVRYFAVLVPLVPLGDMGEYIECQTCKKTWNPKVLEYDPAITAHEYAAEFELAVRRVMVLMMTADGEVHKDEIKTIRRIYRQITQVELGEDEVWDEIAAARKDGRGIRQYLPELTGRLNTSGRELVLKAALFVAVSDGGLTREESAMLEDVARALEMSPTRVREIINEMPGLRS